MLERHVKEHGKQESELPRSGLYKSGLEPGTLPIPDFERLKCLDASGLIAAGCIEMSLSFLKELVQSVYDTFALGLEAATSGAPGSSTEIVRPKAVDFWPSITEMLST